MDILLAMKTIIIAGGALALSASSGLTQDTSFGERLYHEKADCAFCHGPKGDGRGDPRSPGKAANLRTTILKREHLIEVITCGRPRTEMPHFDKYAYEDTACYGLTLAQVGGPAGRARIAVAIALRSVAERAVRFFMVKTLAKRGVLREPRTCRKHTRAARNDDGLDR